MESDDTDTLVQAKRSVIKGHGGNLGLHTTIAGDEVNGERVPSRLPAIVRLVGKRDGVTWRG